MRISIFLALTAFAGLTTLAIGQTAEPKSAPTQAAPTVPDNPSPDEAASEASHPKGLNYDDLDYQDELFLWKGEPYTGPSFSMFKKSKRLHMQMEFKAGRRHGVQTEYFEDGKRKTIATFKAGVQDGLNVYWDEEGNKVLERIWKDGEVISETPKPSPKAEARPKE